MSRLLISRGNEEIFEIGEYEGGQNPDTVSQPAYDIANENIDISRINPSDAYRAFNSSGLLEHRRSVSYTKDDVLENPWDKLNRIKADLNDLKVELSNDEMIGYDTSETSLLSSLMKETLKLTEDCGSLGRSIKEQAACQRLFHPNAFHQVTSEGISTQSEQFVHPHAAKDDLMLLEKRLSLLEGIFGSVYNNIDRDTILASTSSLISDSFGASFTSRSLLDTLRHVEVKLSLLDSSSFDTIKNKISTLKMEIELIKSKSSLDSKTVDMLKRIEDIVVELRMIESFAQELPALLIRLKTLADTHAVATGVKEQIDNLKDGLGWLRDEVSSNREIMHQLQANLRENLIKLDSNAKSLESKIQSLL
jgi:hypothetical protein